MTLFLDLDGPLLDVAPRYVALHHHLLAEAGRTGLPRELYWRRKRARVTEERILQELGASEHAPWYLRRRKELIESPEFLAYDRGWPWVEQALTDLAGLCELVLVTVRSHRAALLAELERLGLVRFFREVLSVPAEERVDQQKAGLITDYLLRHHQRPQRGGMVGDTEADIGAGRLAGLFTVGVLCGIRDRMHLAGACPGLLLDDIRGLPRRLSFTTRFRQKE
jgi:phosphoglycolate phosphatase-like HAD superfamily hydrolase